MTNPAYNPQAPQSEQKLRIYSYYLEVYSGILLQQRHVPKIHVYDLMVGKGTYNGNDGSAMHALKICEKLRQAYGKEIHLYLNEKDPEHYRALCENINPTDNNWVKEMESREQILVEKTPHAPGRRKGNFYLSYKYFNDPVKITVKSLHHGD